MHVNVIKLDITISKTLIKLPSSGHYISAQTCHVCPWWWSLETVPFTGRSHAIHMIFTWYSHTWDLIYLIHASTFFSQSQRVEPHAWNLSALVYMRSLAATSKHILYQAVIKVYWPVREMTCIYFIFFFSESLFFLHALLFLSRTIRFICMSNWTDLNY